MDRLITTPMAGDGLTRRQLMMLGLFSMAEAMLPLVRSADASLKDDLEWISSLPGMAKREGPLLVLRDFVADADGEVEHHIRSQVSQRKDLLSTLKEKIGFEHQVRLSVEDISVRLMYVPQRQEGAPAAYHRYCLAVTDYLSRMCQKENIFTSITSPTQSHPPIPDTGICAILVHRLAKDYQAVCRFTAESGHSVKYKVAGAIFSNHMGAVDLNIEILADGQFGLTRSPFTIWQNNSDGISTLMAVPVEESLHYWLGAATDRQIADALQQDPPRRLADARRLAEEWMAVEESVVGGLVEHVLARYCTDHQMDRPVSVKAEMDAAIASLQQYRYRAHGIKLVEHLGFEQTMASYLQSPASFRDQLARLEEA